MKNTTQFHQSEQMLEDTKYRTLKSKIIDWFNNDVKLNPLRMLWIINCPYSIACCIDQLTYLDSVSVSVKQL